MFYRPPVIYKAICDTDLENRGTDLMSRGGPLPDKWRRVESGGGSVCHPPQHPQSILVLPSSARRSSPVAENEAKEWSVILVAPLPTFYKSLQVWLLRGTELSVSVIWIPPLVPVKEPGPSVVCSQVSALLSTVFVGQGAVLCHH